jgi:hypothetical protein
MIRVIEVDVVEQWLLIMQELGIDVMNVKE